MFTVGANGMGRAFSAGLYTKIIAPQGRLHIRQTPGIRLSAAHLHHTENIITSILTQKAKCVIILNRLFPLRKVFLMKLSGIATDDLFKMIQSEPEKFMNSISVNKRDDIRSMFTDNFNRLLQENGLTISQLVYKTPFSQSYLYQVASGTRRMSRDSAIILSFAMSLDLEQTQRLLKYSNNAELYPKVRRDAVIICCIECGMTVEQADDMLLKKSEKGLISNGF